MTQTCSLTPAALADLDKIADYTLARWGADQMERYIHQLMEKCQWIAENPHAGRACKDIHADFFCHPQGRHLVFYVPDSSGVKIIGFTHQSMDVVDYFDQ